MRAKEEIQRADKEANIKVETASRKLSLEMKKSQEKLKLEHEEYRADILKRAQEQNGDALRLMKENLIRERNREIEEIIEKLGDETHQTEKQLMAQYEKKAHQLTLKHKEELTEYQTSGQQWGEKYRGMVETRDLLEEKVKSLTARLSDMQLQVTEKQEQNKKIERINMEITAKLEKIHDDQTVARQSLESQMRKRLEDRDREIMVLKE